MEKYMEKSMKTGSKTDIMARGRRGKGKNQAKRFLLAVVALLLLKKVVRHWTGVTACTLILSGGIGNIIDRIVHGYVVDMFDLQLFSYPVFNLADCCVVVGAILGGVYYLFLYDKYDKKKKESDHAHDPSDPS